MSSVVGGSPPSTDLASLAGEEDVAAVAMARLAAQPDCQRLWMVFLVYAELRWLQCAAAVAALIVSKLLL